MKKPQKQAFLMIHRNREAISRKAQGLPINTIIIAALALVVLIILIGIVATRSQKFGKGVSETTGAQDCPGEIKSVSQCENPIVGNFKDITANKVCCETTSSSASPSCSGQGGGCTTYQFCSGQGGRSVGQLDCAAGKVCCLSP